MRERQKFLLLSVIFYSCSSANIYLAFRFSLSGAYLYPIFFWILFGFDKIITLIKLRKESQKVRFLSFLADFFQLGTVYLLFYDSPFALGSTAIGFALFRVLPLLLTQSILYFCGDLLSNPLISSQEVFLAYFLFLAYIIIAIVCLFESFNDKQLKYLPGMLPFLAGFTLLSSSVLISKDNSFNLGYLHIIFTAINIITVVIYQNKIIKNAGQMFLHIMDSLFFLFNLEQYKSLRLLRLTYISSYYQMLIKFILVLCFGLEKLIDFYKNTSNLSSYETIQFVNLTLALTFGSLYAVYYFKQFVTALVDFKVIFLSNTTEIIKAMKYLKETKKLPHNITFIFYQISEIDKKRFSLFHVKKFKNMSPLEECLNTECQLHYQLLSLINSVMNKKGQNVELNTKTLQLICIKHYMEYLEKSPHQIKGWGLNFIYRKRIDFNQISQFVSKRIENGLASSKLTLKIINNCITKKALRKWFFSQTAMIMSVNAFYILISPSMLYSSQRILYDLYGD